MKSMLLFLSLFVVAGSLCAQKAMLPPSKVDFPAFMKLAEEVQTHRQSRLLHLNAFLEATREPGTVVLDTRSRAMYDEMHLKGALHLEFSNFTQANLDLLIPDKSTRILIYCNNNFDDAPRVFATKVALPVSPDAEPLTLALNIPTFINLYGYGYRNVYELADFVSIADSRLEFEGHVVAQPSNLGP